MCEKSASGTRQGLFAFCIANIESAIYVLHAFQKKTQQTAKQDLELAERRLKEI